MPDRDLRLLRLDLGLPGALLRHRSHPVDTVEPEDTLEHLVAFGGACGEKFGEPTLSEQHRTTKGVEIEAEQLNDLGVDLGLADNLLQLFRIFAVVLQVIQGMVACPLLAQHPLRLPQVSVDVEAEGNRAVIGALMDERLGALADGGGATVEGERDRIQDARLSAADRADDADEPSLPEVKRRFVAKVGPEVPQPELNRTHRLPPPAPM